MVEISFVLGVGLRVEQFCSWGECHCLWMTCADVCCDEGQVCFEGSCCTPVCAECGVSNGCGAWYEPCTWLPVQEEFLWMGYYPYTEQALEDLAQEMGDAFSMRRELRCLFRKWFLHGRLRCTIRIGGVDSLGWRVLQLL